jgi:cell division protein FtsN
MTADCAGHRVRLGETTGYPERNLLGERRVLRPPEADWRVPEAGTALDNAWRLVCDKSFVGPFQDGANHVTRDDVPPPEASAPAAAAPAAPPPPAAAPPTKAPPRASRATPVSIATQAQAPAAAPRGAGGVAVQVGSYPDVASANAALAALRDGRAHGVEQAKVGGRTWYRVVVSGFATMAEANDYCSQHQAAGGACFVRAAPNG